MAFQPSEFPGSGTARVLAGEHLGDIAEVYVFQEPDQGGASFVHSLAARIGSL